MKWDPHNTMPCLCLRTIWQAQVGLVCMARAASNGCELMQWLLCTCMEAWKRGHAVHLGGMARGKNTSRRCCYLCPCSPCPSCLQAAPAASQQVVAPWVWDAHIDDHLAKSNDAAAAFFKKHGWAS